MDHYKKLQREVMINRVVLLVLVGMVAILGYKLSCSKSAHRYAPMQYQNNGNKNLPFYDTIMGIVAPLEYSGFPDLVKPEVSLSIDFSKRIWTLHNLHEFDDQGNVILDHNRYGLCGELATYVSRKLKPVLGDRYKLGFVKASESGFFLSPSSSHIIIALVDKLTNENYFLDPSFHRYGRAEDFDDYNFFGLVDILSILNNSTRDVFFTVEFGTPILIRNNYLIFFSVDPVDGKFDKDNFALTVTANQRYKYSGRYLIAIRKKNGAKETYRNAWLLEQLLSDEEQKTLIDKMNTWADKL